MVLSLVNLALISITDGIKNGTMQNPYMLPPNLRQVVLDTAINRRIVDDPKCLALLISILNDTKSISIQIDRWYTTKFFDRLTESMRTMLLNGERMDPAITKLHLREFYYDIGTLNAKTSPRTRWKHVLENWAENCIELSISNSLDLADGYPFINFNQLTKLKLDSCDIYYELWPRFLRNIPTLEHLQMIHVTFGMGLDAKVLGKYLPISMPHLKSLEISGKYRRGPRRQHFNFNKSFIDNLMGCPELRQLRLMLDESSTDEAALIRLANMVADRNITMKINARFIVSGHDKANSAAFDSSSNFMVVRIFHERIDSIELFYSGEWKPHFSTTLEDVVTTCLNLTTFHIDIHDLCYRLTNPQAEPISKEDMKRINAALVQFFGNSERALQLKDLRLVGNFDEAIVSAVFKNCLNLIQLEITDCPALRDQHLIDWADRGGGKLSKFTLHECENVTSEGIIPILVKSAEELLRYLIYVGESSGGRNWRAVLENHCPNAQWGSWKY